MSTPRFLKSAAARGDFPPDSGREVAFVGRSNSGKSTAINATLGIKKLARVSKTPGRTRLVNFFELAPERRVVDLPGYGFARVPDAVRDAWRRLLDAYFSERRSLGALLLTVDIRRGLGPLDGELLAWIEPRRLPVGILLTKADKLARAAGMQREREAAAAAGVARVTRFSALDGSGVDLARAWLDEWLAMAADDALVSRAGRRI